MRHTYAVVAFIALAWTELARVEVAVAYHVDQPHLRVLASLTRDPENQKRVSACRILMLQHSLPTTAGMVDLLLKAGAEIFAFIAKPYSRDPVAERTLESLGISVESESYDTLDKSDYLADLLQRAIAKSKTDGKRIVVLEVGGYFANALSKLSEQDASYVAGVVEDTTFGHLRYERMPRLSTPVYSVARSPLKEIEARHVGRDAVAATDMYLRALGVSLPGRRALVLGYGMIGSNIAKALRRHDLRVAVHDTSAHRLLQAFKDGYVVHTKNKLCENSDIVFSATASTAMTFDEIRLCANNVILASAGSRDTEFDVASLRQQANRIEEAAPGIEAFHLTHSKRVFVLRKGTAVNFALPSIPTEVLDLVFSEIFACLSILLSVKTGSGRRQVANQSGRRARLRGRVNVCPEVHRDFIAREWMRLING